MSEMFEDDEFSKARKSLLLIACGMLIFYVFHDKIESINLFGTEVQTVPGHKDVWLVLIVFLVYKFARFIQMVESPSDVMVNRYLSIRDVIAYKMSVRGSKKKIVRMVKEKGAFPEPNNLPRQPVAKVYWRWEPRPEYLYAFGVNDGMTEFEREKLKDVIRDRLGFTAAITYVCRYTVDMKHFSFSGDFDIEISPSIFVSVSSRFFSIVYVVIFERWFSDFVLPVILSGLSFSLAVVALI
ncbi:hypothetical protein FXN65_15470 [Metapseudomonas lalkuanensis]|uniref:Uncharacterized protein n=1 Tax=Metapseudomonas lalkuanensis TaxID=2604832 RepID=A0A5J6QLK6_9GAMM|nr:hypothetical protein [Pseudomonas lalkuanensis]QEY63384.1 hypothetical protein FXN65_15470 [Pseudomonas lalkuanensis]